MSTCPSGLSSAASCLILAVVFGAAGCAAPGAGDGFPVLTGDYLGQTPPGDVSEPFAPGIVTTGMYTRDVALTPDGDELYFCVAVGGYRYSAILLSKRVDGRWTEPEVAPFSGNPDWMDLEPAISHDGQRFYFLSTRPVGDEEPGEQDIWVMDREGEGWSEPLNMGDTVNSAAGTEWSPYVSSDGKYLFFMSDRTIGLQDAAGRSYAEVLAGLEAPGQGSAGIYWVDAGFIEDLRRQAQESEGAGEEAAVVEPSPGETASTTAISKGTPPWGDTFPVLRGEYLGQSPPGPEPVLFAPGIVSNALTNRDLAITPDGKEIFFGVAFGRRVAVAHTRQVDGVWTEPDFAPFSRDPEAACFEPALSSDGNSLYFLSNRAAQGQEERPGWGNQNIFRVTREGEGWSEPEALPAPITTDGFEYYPSLTATGTLYFTKSERGGNASIARSRLVDGAYEDPVVLGPEVNIGEDNVNAYVARDESYLITCVRGSERNIGEVDYYISFRRDDDTWTEAVNLGEPINLPGTRAASSSVSPDGKYFFFASDRTNEAEILPEGTLTRDALMRLHGEPRNGASDIYWMEAGFIEKLRSQQTSGDTPGRVDASPSLQLQTRPGRTQGEVRGPGPRSFVFCA